MRSAPKCLLTTKDFTILEVMLERCHGTTDPLVPILRRKLDEATVVFREDVPGDVVTLNSRVTYRIGDSPAETRIIAQEKMHGMVGLLLPITNPRGLAMLGLSEGDTETVLRADGVEELIHVQAVVYQPEAARREATKLGLPDAEEAAPPRPQLRIVHSVDAPTVTPPTIRRPPSGGWDDPGPSAA